MNRIRTTIIAMLVALLLVAPALAATTASLIHNPKFLAIDENGDPLAGGKLYTYTTGTTTPKATWTDATKATPNANPVVLDLNGEANVWLDSSGGAYRLKLDDVSDVPQWTIDDIEAINNQTITDAIAAALPTQALGTNYCYPDAAEADQGVATGGMATIKDCVDAIGATSKGTIVLTRGSTGNTTDYTLTTSETITSNIMLGVEDGAIIGGVGTLTIDGPFEAGLYQVFSGAGSVSFGGGSVRETYPEWWYSTGSWHTAINTAITSFAGRCFLSDRNYDTTGTVILTNILVGSGAGTQLIYSGNGSAVTISGPNTELRDIHIVTSDAAANGIEINGNAKHNVLQNFRVSFSGDMALSTGTGVLVNGDVFYLGLLSLHKGQIYYYKYGIKIIGEVTSVSCYELHMFGKVTGDLVAGSVGIWYGGTGSNCSSTILGGAIECYETGIIVESGKSLWARTFFELNTDNWTTDFYFKGSIEDEWASEQFSRHVHSAGGVVYDIEHKDSGNWYRESYYCPTNVMTEEGGKIRFYGMNVSNPGVMDGGVAFHKAGFEISSHQSHQFNKNRMRINDFYLTWHSSAPSGGTWGRGSVVYNSVAAVGQPIGWMCTASGSFNAAATTGDITNGSVTLTVADASGFDTDADGAEQYITIAGVTGIKRIRSTVGNVITIDTAADATVAGAAVATPDPTWTAMALL